MSNRTLRDQLPHFNAALDACKGKRTEKQFAAWLGVTDRTLYDWRRGESLGAAARLIACPKALIALTKDADFFPMNNSTTKVEKK